MVRYETTLVYHRERYTRLSSNNRHHFAYCYIYITTSLPVIRKIQYKTNPPYLSKAGSHGWGDDVCQRGQMKSSLCVLKFIKVHEQPHILFLLNYSCFSHPSDCLLSGHPVINQSRVLLRRILARVLNVCVYCPCLSVVDEIAPFVCICQPRNYICSTESQVTISDYTS